MVGSISGAAQGVKKKVKGNGSQKGGAIDGADRGKAFEEARGPARRLGVSKYRETVGKGYQMPGKKGPREWNGTQDGGGNGNHGHYPQNLPPWKVKPKTIKRFRG